MFLIFITIFLFSFLNCKNHINYQIPIDSNSEKVKISKIETNSINQIYLIEDLNYWKTNSLFVITSKNVYFFSSGWNPKSAKQILWKAKTLTHLPFIALILVSPSLEFSGGIFEFIETEKIPAYIQKDGYDYLMENWQNWHKQMKKKFSSWEEMPKLPNFAGLIEDKFVIEDNIILFYPKRIKEPGNLVVYFSKEEILYAGNLLFDPNEIEYNFQNTNVKEWLSFLKKIQDMKIKRIISGKGKALQKKDLIEKLIQFMNSKNLNNN
ncbi:MAG: hypothetical protein ACK4UJ_04985 [Leptonema sp. (in: bacteria)]